MRTPLQPGRTGQNADMRGATVRSTSRVRVVRSDSPSPPESAYLGKADAGLSGGFTPDLSLSPGKENMARYVYERSRT